MSKKFKVEPHTTVDKFFDIYNEDIRLTVDYDDVDHKTVDKEVKRIIKILNSIEDNYLNSIEDN